MAIERFRLSGRGRKRSELVGQERDVLKRDLHALRIVRDILFPGTDWSKQTEENKKKFYKQIIDYLGQFPSHLEMGEVNASKINDSLSKEKLLPEHALEGAGYMLKGKVKELKVEKFTKVSRPRRPVSPPAPPSTPYAPRAGGRPVGAVAGRVIDAGKGSVAGANVVVTAVNGRQYSGQTDDNGEFFIDNVPASRIPWQPGTRVESCPVHVYMTYMDEVASGAEPRRAVGQATVVVTAGEVNRCNPETIQINMERRSRERLIRDYLDGRGPMPAGYHGAGRPLGAVTQPFRSISRSAGSRLKNVLFSLILIVIGITITAVTGNFWFLAGFLFLGFHIILPDPEGIDIRNEAVDHGTGGMNFFGSYLLTPENRTRTGIAFLKAVTELGVIICFIVGLYTQQFPLSNIILLIFAFASYFRLPVEFQPSRPHEFIRSFFRVLLGLFIAIFIFGAFGAGIFQSKELGWLTIAFFVVFPVATERENLARALGIMGSASGESYETIDKIIFIVIMVMFAVVYGFSFVGGFFSGTGGIVFSAVWILGLVAGLMTPAETRPWMGIIILIVGFIVFGLGAGQQATGVAFFGEWWPTVHNSVTEFMEPIGDMFAQFQMTFGQSWLLFTNPVGYAQQITQGTYAQNELGVEGAYGLEIRKFQVQSIYIDEPFMIEIELENKGIFDAKNIKIDIMTNINKFQIGKDQSSLGYMQYRYEDKYEKKWYSFALDQTNNLGYKLDKLERQNIVPIFLVGKMSCGDFESTAWRDFGVLGGKNHTIREMFIPFVINITYEYEATSNLQMDFISNDEWRRLSLENKLDRGPKTSVISTAPASLNLGSMDQPIKEDSPFYVGFNLTSTWFKNTLITEGKVDFYVPKDFDPFDSDPSKLCTKATTAAPGTGDYQNHNVYTFNLASYDSKAAFCSYKGLKQPPRPLSAPKKTYVIFANATYTFSKWDGKDTQVNFKDVCWPREASA